MLIFNTTFLVSDKVHGVWLKWVHEQHIPFMLETTFFSKPQVAKILTNEDLNFSVTKRKVTQLRKYEVKSSKQQKLVMIGGKDEEEKATQILSANPVKAILDIHAGEEKATAWGCDLTYEYVTINADYRS